MGQALCKSLDLKSVSVFLMTVVTYSSHFAWNFPDYSRKPHGPRQTGMADDPRVSCTERWVEIF